MTGLFTITDTPLERPMFWVLSEQAINNPYQRWTAIWGERPRQPITSSEPPHSPWWYNILLLNDEEYFCPVIPVRRYTTPPYSIEDGLKTKVWYTDDPTADLTMELAR